MIKCIKNGYILVAQSWTFQFHKNSKIRKSKMDILKMSKMENMGSSLPEKRAKIRGARRCFDPRKYNDFVVTNWFFVGSEAFFSLAILWLIKTSQKIVDILVKIVAS